LIENFNLEEMLECHYSGIWIRQEAAVSCLHKKSISVLSRGSLGIFLAQDQILVNITKPQEILSSSHDRKFSQQAQAQV
jgi:hypothetical protein